MNLVGENGWRKMMIHKEVTSTLRLSLICLRSMLSLATSTPELLKEAWDRVLEYK